MRRNEQYEQAEHHSDYDRRSGLRRSELHGRYGLPHAASGRDGAGGHALYLHVFQFSGVFAVARVAADRSLSRKRGRSRHSGRTSPRFRPYARGAHDCFRAQAPRIPYRTVRQMASGSEAGMPPERERLRRVLRLPRRLHRLLFPHLLLGNGRRPHRSDPRPVGERSGGLRQRRIHDRADHPQERRVHSEAPRRAVHALRSLQRAALSDARAGEVSEAVRASAVGSPHHGSDDQRRGRWRGRDSRGAGAPGHSGKHADLLPERQRPVPRDPQLARRHRRPLLRRHVRHIHRAQIQPVRGRRAHSVDRELAGPHSRRSRDRQLSCVDGRVPDGAGGVRRRSWAVRAGRREYA